MACHVDRQAQQAFLDWGTAPIKRAQAQTLEPATLLDTELGPITVWRGGLTIIDLP
jgi:hypothetical protein